MGASLLQEVLAKPVIAVVSSALIGVWAALANRRMGYAEVGFSYDQVVHQHQLWRLLTATFSHVDIIHLLFNVSGLWSLGYAEVLMGSARYATITLLLVLLTNVVAVGMYYAGIHWAKREQLARVTCLGYSGVLFGWMTELSVRNPGGISSLSLFGLVNIPLMAAPWASLLLTSLLIPQASFVGHAAGIIVGYVLALSGLDNMSPWVALTIVGWLALVSLYIAISHKVPLPFVRYHTAPADIESGLTSGGANSLGVRLIS